MKRVNQKSFCIAAVLFAAFAVWTVLVRLVDVRPIGPQGSSVGFAGLNGFVHSLTGVHMTLYIVTDWMGLVPVCVCVFFAFFGLWQLIKRKGPLKVDFDILVLGVFYIAVFASYLLFEIFVINYRPILIEGRLEASYPSSTTMLVMCIMPTALMQAKARIKNKAARCAVVAIISVFSVFMVVGRLISGVHWFSDIAGGAFLSAGLVMAYRFAVSFIGEE